MQSSGDLIAQARRERGLSRAELARHANTSRPTLSAYEHGHKSPTLDTASRILAAMGYQLTVQPLVRVAEYTTARGRPVSVPNRLPYLPPERALATVSLPLHLNWSDPTRRYRMSDRAQRARVYEIVLREGLPADILTYIDGTLLLDLWNDLILPHDIRTAWQPVIDASLTATDV